MAGESQFSLFGMPTPEEIRARIGRTQEEQAASMTANPSQANMHLAGQRLGGGIAGMLGYQDPLEAAEIEKANTMRSIMSSAYQASEGDLDKYVPEVARQFMAAGLYPEAMQALQFTTDQEHTRAKTQKATAEAEKALAMPLLEEAKIQQAKTIATQKQQQWEQEFKFLERKFDRSTVEGNRDYEIESAKLRVQQAAEQRQLDASRAKIEDFYSKIGYRAGLLQVYTDRLELAKTKDQRDAATNRLSEMRADLFRDFQSAKLEQLKDVYPDAESISDLPAEASLPIMREINQFMSSANVLEQLLGNAIFHELSRSDESDPLGIE